jgi:hypothetical protein
MSVMPSQPRRSIDRRNLHSLHIEVMQSPVLALATLPLALPSTLILLLVSIIVLLVLPLSFRRHARTKLILVFIPAAFAVYQMRLDCTSCRKLRMHNQIFYHFGWGSLESEWHEHISWSPSSSTNGVEPSIVYFATHCLQYRQPLFSHTLCRVKKAEVLHVKPDTNNRDLSSQEDRQRQFSCCIEAPEDHWYDDTVFPPQSIAGVIPREIEQHYLFKMDPSHVFYYSQLQTLNFELELPMFEKNTKKRNTFLRILQFFNYGYRIPDTGYRIPDTG